MRVCVCACVCVCHTTGISILLDVLGEMSDEGMAKEVETAVMSQVRAVTHTYTHTHTHRERETHCLFHTARQRDREGGAEMMRRSGTHTRMYARRLVCTQACVHAHEDSNTYHVCFFFVCVCVYRSALPATPYVSWQLRLLQPWLQHSQPTQLPCWRPCCIGLR